jgi:hypothetical protein
MIVIAGSGPAGAFAALGALEAGAEVLMIDAGLVLDKPAVHTPESVTVSGLSEKRVFGSDFATQPLQHYKEINCRILHSNALGGLSNVWGRGVEPPYGGVREAQLPSFQAVLNTLPFCAEEDNLAEVMPLYAPPKSTHQLTSASQALLDFWNRNSAVLNRSGIHFGKTRLALQNCKYCAQCFYGCTYQAMWSADQLIADLKRRFPKFTYRGEVLLKSFSEHPEGVALELEHIANHAPETLHATRLILACGAPETTRIVLRSTGNREAILKNSDLIKIAFLSLRRARAEETYHALSQLTLAVNHRAISQKPIVIHLFGQNPAIESAALSLLPKMLHGLSKWLLARFYVGMCFLHSDDSGEIHLREENGSATFTGRPKRETKTIYPKLLMLLAARVWKTGLLPIPVVGGLAPIGHSVHYGASLKTDAHGALENHTHVYVADASALPDIPAGSYTLSIMAQAWKTGTNAASN